MAAGPLFLFGCSALPVTPDARAPWGHIVVRPGKAGLVIAAPHGSSDAGTDAIAAELARRSGFGLVIASGFAIESSDTGERAGRRYQVNRPFEGTPGRPAAEETHSPGALRVYEMYEQQVRETAQGHLSFYAEIHGNNRRDSSGQIEIATVGIDGEGALRLRALLELVRDAHLRGAPRAPRLMILIEGVDTVRYTASGAKRDGILRLPERALHIELPRAARTEWRDVYTAILADFLTEAAALRLAR